MPLESGEVPADLLARVVAESLEADQDAGQIGSLGVPGRPYTAPPTEGQVRDDDAPAATPRGRFGILERETGLEPATLGLGSRCSTS